VPVSNYSNYEGIVDFVNAGTIGCALQMSKHTRRDQTRTDRQMPRAGELLVSNKVLTLATLLRRSATLVYRRELGLSQIEWRILAIIGDRAPLTLGQIVTIMGLDKGQTSRGVTSLVRRRILARSSDEREGREVQIDLTARGRETFTSLMAIALTRNRNLVVGIGKTELQTIFTELDRLIENAKLMLAQNQEKAG
jgi:DNA-binding MarR family transcriptional regulator